MGRMMIMNQLLRHLMQMLRNESLFMIQTMKTGKNQEVSQEAFPGLGPAHDLSLFLAPGQDQDPDQNRDPGQNQEIDPGLDRYPNQLRGPNLGQDQNLVLGQDLYQSPEAFPSPGLDPGLSRNLDLSLKLVGEVGLDQTVMLIRARKKSSKKHLVATLMTTKVQCQCLQSQKSLQPCLMCPTLMMIRDQQVERRTMRRAPIVAISDHWMIRTVTMISEEILMGGMKGQDD